MLRKLEYGTTLKADTAAITQVFLKKTIVGFSFHCINPLHGSASQDLTKVVNHREVHFSR
jgi:hypothetical protein